MNSSLIERVISGHKKRFGFSPDTVAYAPGRVEILGNHTDYNEGYVLSAAIDAGICAAISGVKGNHCVLAALDLNEETDFDLPVTCPLPHPAWANYIRGVISKLDAVGKNRSGFNMTFAGDVPPGAGLSSSAALEVATALALCNLFNLRHGKSENALSVIPNRVRNLCHTDNLDEIPSTSSGQALRCAQDDNTVKFVTSLGPDFNFGKMQIAKLCQQAENEFTGTRCGLLDQISSLFGLEHALVFTDFRTLAVETVPMRVDTCFLLANTRVKHNLVESAYNERRAACEKAARFFAKTLHHPVHALRDVSMAELSKHSATLDPIITRRARHIIGENERVLEGRKFLHAGQLKEFGKLMFASHESSRVNFENSCAELDFIVESTQKIKEVLGARLSGGGFGGSVVMLTIPEDTAKITDKLTKAYASRFGHPCSMQSIKPSAGARVVERQRW